MPKSRITEKACESMEEVRKTLEELEQSELRNPIDPQTREYLGLLYGPPNTLQMHKADVRPPSPMHAIEESTKFLNREVKKGFLEPFDIEDYKKKLLRPAIIAQANHLKQRKNVQKFDLEKLYETEQYQKFWLTSNTVSKIKKEITSLPFHNHHDISVVTDRFLESVASIVRVMNHRNMLDNDGKHKKKQLQASMLHFITETYKARVKIIKYTLKQEYLDVSKLSDKLKQEFAEDLIQETSPNDEDDPRIQGGKKNDPDQDERILDQITANCAKLPRLYRYTSYRDSEERSYKLAKNYGRLLNKNLQSKNQSPVPSKPLTPVKESEQVDGLNSSALLDDEGFPIYQEKPQTEKKDEFDIGIEIPKKMQLITIPFARTKKAANQEVVDHSDSFNMPKQELHVNYWKTFDPLHGNRPGDDVNLALEQIHSYSDKFTPDYSKCRNIDYSLPFKLEYEEILESQSVIKKTERARKRRRKQIKVNSSSNNFIDSSQSSTQVMSIGPKLIGEIWSTSDLVVPKSIDQTNYLYAYQDIEKDGHGTDEEEEEEEADDEAFKRLRHNDDFFDDEVDDGTGDLYKPNDLSESERAALEASHRNMDAYRFLNSFKFSKNSRTAASIVQKLEEIWNSLGFTVQQKLALLVKYTTAPEETQRLREALGFYENALEGVNQYNKAYQALKDFVKFEADSTTHAETTCHILLKQVENCEENVKQIAAHLINSFGDELIIKKKTISELLPARHKKMMEMIKPFCKDEENDHQK